MKNLALTLLLIMLMYSCNDASYVDIEKSTTNNVHSIVPQKIVRNGYKKKECVKGNLISTDYYAKVVFVDEPTENNNKIHYYVTKYAYSYVVHNYYMRNHNMFKKKTTQYLTFSIFGILDTRHILKVTKRWLEKDIYGRITGENIFPLYNIVGIFNKQQYNQWMKDHPETHILEY